MIGTQTHELHITYNTQAQGYYGTCDICYDVDEMDGRLVATGAYFSPVEQEVKDIFWDDHVGKFPGDILKGA